MSSIYKIQLFENILISMKKLKESFKRYEQQSAISRTT